MTGQQLRIGFVADSRGTIAEILLSEPVSRAYDIMTAAGFTPENAAELAAAAERSGRDPVAFAEHAATATQARESCRGRVVR